MSARMTSIKAPGIAGIAVYGRETRAEMIVRYHKHAEHLMREAQAAMAVTDDELVVTTYSGPWARTNEKVVTE